MLRNKDKEKQKLVVAIDFNSTPIGLLRALRFMIVILFIVAWATPFVGLLEYMLGYISIIILLFAGFDLKKRKQAFGWWFVLMLALTLFFGLFAMGNNYILFVIGAYATPVFGNIVPLWKIEKDMKENETLAEVMSVGYFEKEGQSS